MNELLKDDWLLWCHEHEDELRYALRKNITYDEDIFDDVTADTVIRIAEYILKNGIELKNKSFMFFTCAKRQYIAVQNKRRKQLMSHVRGYFDADDEGDVMHDIGDDMESALKEEKAVRVHELFNRLGEELNKVFPPNEVDIFMIYFRLKSERNGISYKKLASIVGRDVRYITNVIVKIKKYARTNDKIKRLRKEVMDGSEFG